MKKIIVLIFFTIGLVKIYSQDSELQQLVFKIDSVLYKVGTTKIKIKISVQNNSTKDVHILRPQPFLFNEHNSEKDETGKHGLLSTPYKIIIKGDKMCKAEYPSNLVATEDGKQSKLLKYLVTIPVGKELQFDEILIDYNNGEFCKRSDYMISISYKPNLHIYQDYEAKQIMEFYAEIINKSKYLNRELGADSKEFHLIKQTNFQNFKNFIENTLPEIREINGIEFKSTETNAIEEK